MIKDDVKVGVLFYSNTDNIVYKIIELTEKGFKYELANKELYPHGISRVPRLGLFFTGDGEIFSNDAEYILDCYKVLAEIQTYEI